MVRVGGKVLFPHNLHLCPHPSVLFVHSMATRVRPNTDSLVLVSRGGHLYVPWHRCVIALKLAMCDMMQVFTMYASFFRVIKFATKISLACCRSRILERSGHTASPSNSVLKNHMATTINLIKHCTKVRESYQKQYTIGTHRIFDAYGLVSHVPSQSRALVAYACLNAQIHGQLIANKAH